MQQKLTNFIFRNETLFPVIYFSAFPRGFHSRRELGCARTLESG